MILFLILLFISIILLVFGVLMLSAIGAGALIIFGDVFVCVFIIGIIIKKIFFNKRK